jgi:hypothetical protein
MKFASSCFGTFLKKLSHYAYSNRVRSSVELSRVFFFCSFCVPLCVWVRNIKKSATMSWQTTANDRLSDFKENALEKMSSSSSSRKGDKARNDENDAEEDGKVESLLLKNLSPPPNDDDEENGANENIFNSCCRVLRGESCKKFGLCWLLLLFSFFMVGTVLLFWEDMHANNGAATMGRPLVSDAADENLAEEAEEFGTTITELAEELKDEALEAEVVDPAAFQR